MKFVSRYIIINFVLCACIHASTPKEEQAEPYQRVAYSDFVDYLEDLQKTRFYNSLFRVSNSFTKYEIENIPSCRTDVSEKCQNPLIEVTNFENGDDFVKTLPTILLVGGFHGDETVGTQSLFYLIKYIQKYYEIDKDLYDLLQNTRLLILPMANVDGFEKLKREETVMVRKGVFFEVDPNRDFSFDAGTNKCFQTTTARVLDRIFRDNLIISVVTFHGGANSITYPWGNFAHSKNPATSDNAAFANVATLLKGVVGSNYSLKIEQYETGTMQKVVYNVNGGFEDWAYAASFDIGNVSKTCARSKTSSYIQPYPTSSNRAFVFLVEAGPIKNPADAYLGNELGLRDPQSPDAVYGHIARNIKLSLALAEVTAPQIIIDRVAFSTFLDIDLRVKGCATLDSMVVLTYGYQNFEKTYDFATQEYKVSLSIKATEMYYPEIILKAVCDSSWRKANVKPESHLVNLRLTQNYHVENNGYIIQNKRGIEAVISNIRLSDLKMSFLSMAPNGRFSVVYSSSLEAIFDSNKIKFLYEDGSMLAHYDHESEQTVDTGIRIKRFGSRQTDDVSIYSILLEFKPNEKVPMSFEYFYNLQGRSLEIYNLTTNNPVLESHISSINNDADNLLTMPPAGLSCGTSKNDANYFYAQVNYQNDRKNIQVDLYTNVRKSFKFKVNGLQNELLEYAEFNNKQFPNIISYTQSVKVPTANDLKLVGAKFQLLADDELEYSCILMRKDPNYVEENFMEILEKENKVPEIAKANDNNPTDWRLFVVLLVILLTVSLIVIILKRQGREDPVKPSEEAQKLSLVNEANLTNQLADQA